MIERNFVYETCCVNANGADIRAMVDTATTVRLSTIRRRCVAVDQWAREMGYGRWLRLQNDYHVAYYRSSYCGRRCYFITHSAIEHVWVEP